MFRRNVVLLLVIFSACLASLGIIQAADRRPLTRSKARELGVELPSIREIAALLPAARTHRAVQIAVVRGMRTEQINGALAEACAEEFLAKLSRTGDDRGYRKKDLVPWMKGQLTRWERSVKKAKKLHASMGKKVKKMSAKERLAAEALLRFRAEDIVAALKDSVTAEQLVTKLNEIITFAQEVIAGRSGKLAQAINEVAVQLQGLRDSILAIPGVRSGDAVSIHEDEEDAAYGDDDLGAGGIEYGDAGYDDAGVFPQPPATSPLQEFIKAHRRAGYKLLVISVAVGGAAFMAPLYLPTMLVSGAVSAVLSGAVAAVRGHEIVPAMVDGAMSGTLASTFSGAMPVGGLVGSAFSGAGVRAVSAAIEGGDSREVRSAALMGAASGTVSYGVSSWLFGQPQMSSAPLPLVEDRSRALVAVWGDRGVCPVPTVGSCVVPPWAGSTALVPVGEMPIGVSQTVVPTFPHLAPGAVFPIGMPPVEDRSRALIPVFTADIRADGAPVVAEMPVPRGTVESAGEGLWLDRLHETLGTKKIGDCIRAGSGSKECVGLVEGIHATVGTKAVGACLREGSGSVECRELVDGIHSRLGTKAMGEWLKSWWQ